MSKVLISEILDDLRVAEEVLRKFERRFWITSAQFYKLYNEGLLDNGEYTEEFTEWAGFYKLKLKRESAFNAISEENIKRMRRSVTEDSIALVPREPYIEVN
jgi:hypothetical protein